MGKVLKCGDVVPGCNAEIKGDSEHDVFVRLRSKQRLLITWTVFPPTFCRR